MTQLDEKKWTTDGKRLFIISSSVIVEPLSVGKLKNSQQIFFLLVKQYTKVWQQLHKKPFSNPIFWLIYDATVKIRFNFKYRQSKLHEFGNKFNLTQMIETSWYKINHIIREKIENNCTHW